MKGPPHPGPGEDDDGDQVGDHAEDGDGGEDGAADEEALEVGDGVAERGRRGVVGFQDAAVGHQDDAGAGQVGWRHG